MIVESARGVFLSRNAGLTAIQVALRDAVSNAFAYFRKASSDKMDWDLSLNAELIKHVDTFREAYQMYFQYRDFNASYYCSMVVVSWDGNFHTCGFRYERYLYNCDMRRLLEALLEIMHAHRTEINFSDWSTETVLKIPRLFVWCISFII